jgi:Holliday junction DNA helicase RuvA
MFHYIKGIVTMKFDHGVVLESGGIGYEVYVSENSPVYNTAYNEEVMLFTRMIFREDDVSIYGFADRESLSLFEKLTSVNGVGAKAALSILSSMSFDELIKAIIFEDAASLTKAQGIGKKIALRIILELKDKLSSLSIQNRPEAEKTSSSEKDEAIMGLLSLGYTRSEASSAVSGMEMESPTAEDYMKQALRNLLRR